MMDPLSYSSFQPVFHDWCNKDRGMCYPVCGMVNIKESLLLIGKSRPCGGSEFPLSLSEWSFTVRPTTYKHVNMNVLSASLNKNKNFVPSFQFRDTNQVPTTLDWTWKYKKLIDYHRRV